MKLIGEGLQIGKTYYTTPYAIYTTDSGGNEIIYGDSTSFIPEGQVFVSE